MDLNIIDKGAIFELSVVSKQEGSGTYYLGAGWDNPNGPVDLDIVCCALVDGKLTKQKDFVYFGNQTGCPGITLSEDNQTGDGAGDDEDIVINTVALAPEVDRVVVGLVAYAGADLHNAPNTHFRVCDGDNENSEQIGDVKLDGAQPKDTVLVACVLIKTATGWVLENIDTFHQMGNGKAAIEGFAGLYK